MKLAPSVLKMQNRAESLLFLFLLLPTSCLSTTCSQSISSESDIQFVGFVYKSLQSYDLWDCFTKCVDDRVCQSINYDIRLMDCQFNLEIKRRRPSNTRPKYLGVYMENPKRDKKGSHRLLAAHSCKEINDLGEAQGDGEYWIDPENTGNPFTVYCDMTTDSGGWTLIKRAKLDTKTPGNARVDQSDYRAISNYSDWRQNVLVSAISKLRAAMGFHQIRWRCHKKSIGRTVDIRTNNNSAGIKVLHHFLVKATSTGPPACNSFQILPDDNSILAQNCAKWGNTGSQIEVNRWGRHGNTGNWRIYNNAILWENKYYVTFTAGVYYCDDFKGDKFGPLSVGDIWELYVR